MAKSWFTKEADFPLETVLLLIAGMALLITGGLLFPIANGSLPYYENGLYGLLLVIIALQVAALGKTPFGEMERSPLLIAGGMAIGTAGIFISFVPDVFSRIPRLLLFLFLGPGALVMLLRMCLSRDKLRSWIKLGGALFKHLIASCTAVYVLSMLAAALLVRESMLTTRVSAVAVLAFGASVVYLAVVLSMVYREYPEAAKPSGGVSLSTNHVLILFTGLLLLFLGWLLIPVNLGMLPFSGSAQIGLLVVLIALKILASGDTPLLTLPRSWPVIILGVMLAALGIVSCIVPDKILLPLMILIGITNIAGGMAGLWRALSPLMKKTGETLGKMPPILARLTATQVVLNTTTILFGASVFFAKLIPGLVIGVILTINGGILLYMLHILVVIDRMQGGMEAQPAGE